MAKAASSIVLALDPDLVWGMIGGFGSLPDWLPFIPTSELRDGGRVRYLATPDGEVIVERLMTFSERERYYTYHILQAPFPVTGYYSTLRVTGVNDNESSRVDWVGEFTPVGVTDYEASNLFQGIYDDGLTALTKALKG